MNGSNHDYRYQFNNIEKIDDFGLGVNMAVFRTLDPSLGRWWSVDPKAEAYSGMSPYCAMGNSPLVFNDPKGDALPALAMAAIGGGIINTMIQGLQGNINSLGDLGEAFLVGGIAGGLGFGIGSGVSSAIAGGSFGAGFMGTSSISNLGFFAGAISAGAGGFAGGFTSGFGNTLANDGNISSAFNQGLKSGAIGGLSAGVANGIASGIEASKMDLNFWTGTGTFNLADGVGAHNIPISWGNITGKYVGTFEGVPIYESPSLGRGMYSGGITLPGRGIVVGTDVFSKKQDLWLLKHEFGHILQAKEIGVLNFYTFVGPTSLGSATRSGSWGLPHREWWTETWANYLSYNYFGKPNNWPRLRFPIKNHDFWSVFRW